MAYLTYLFIIPFSINPGSLYYFCFFFFLCFQMLSAGPTLVYSCPHSLPYSIWIWCLSLPTMALVLLHGVSSEHLLQAYYLELLQAWVVLCTQMLFSYCLDSSLSDPLSLDLKSPSVRIWMLEAPLLLCHMELWVVTFFSVASIPRNGHRSDRICIVS